MFYLFAVTLCLTENRVLYFILSVNLMTWIHEHLSNQPHTVTVGDRASYLMKHYALAPMCIEPYYKMSIPAHSNLLNTWHSQSAKCLVNFNIMIFSYTKLPLLIYR